MKNKKTKTAFSIIELSIVILIISILAGVMLVANRMNENSTLAAAQTLTKYSLIPEIDGLTLWLETTMPQSFNENETSDGRTITAWHDLSSTRKEFTGTATYVADGLNNLPVLSFSGSNNFIRANSSIGEFVQSNQGTVFLVQNYTSPGTPTSTIFWQVPSTLMRVNVHAVQAAGYLYFDFGTCCTSIARTGAIPTNFSNRYNIVSLLKNYSSSSIFVNGAAFSSNSSATSTVTTTNTPATFYVGSNDAGAFYFIGTIAEIIIFERALSDKEIDIVEKYLSKKWGISIQ